MGHPDFAYTSFWGGPAVGRFCQVRLLHTGLSELPIGAPLKCPGISDGATRPARPERPTNEKSVSIARTIRPTDP